MADLFILALTVFTFQNNTKIAINIHLLEIFVLLLVFSYQFTAKYLSLPPPLLGGAISKPLTLPFALAFRTSNIETVVQLQDKCCHFKMQVAQIRHFKMQRAYKWCHLDFKLRHLKV